MRIVSFGPAGDERPGFLFSDGIVPLAVLGDNWPRTTRGLLATGRLAEAATLAAAVTQRVPVDSVRLGPPVPHAGKIICVGLNYADHAAEQGKEHPEQPLLFCKTPNALSGPADDILHPRSEVYVDFEVELVVCIGRRASQVIKDEAQSYIAGYMVANDVSARKWQRSDGQWFRGKSCDSFFPCGPALVTADEIADVNALQLTTTVNGKMYQNASSSLLIHKIDALIEYISADITLEPGDLISTGTPAGVGCFQKPPVSLRAGDIVECAITGLGHVRNRVVAR